MGPRRDFFIGLSRAQTIHFQSNRMHKEPASWSCFAKDEFILYYWFEYLKIAKDRLMRKFLSSAVLFILFASNAQAARILIDDFKTAQGPVVDVAGGGATVSATQAPTAGELWSNRSISVLASGAGITTGDPQAVAVGGLFAINNDSLETSTVTLT
jgi:hypothetical protein